MPAVIYELVDKGTFVGQQALIRYHFVDPDGTANVNDLVLDYIGDVIPTLIAFQNSQYSHNSIVYKQVYPTQQLQAETPIVPPQVGDHLSATMPAWITFSIKWIIGPTVHLGGDTGPYIRRGGKHLGGISDDEVTGNVLSNPGDTATHVAAYIAALKGMSSDGWYLCVAHQPPPVAHVSPPVSRYALVQDAVVQGVGTQNTRKLGRGR